MMEKEILHINNIRVSFNNAGKEKLNLLNGVSLNITRGKVTALIGGNGTGKTTLFNIISGFQKDYEGTIIIDGIDISRLPAHQVSLKGIGRLFQGGQLLGDLTLMENMKIASEDMTGESPFNSILHPHQVKEQEQQKEERAREIIRNLISEKYVDKMDKLGSEFSYGEQRLLSLARLLMGEDKLLLLDEPTSGVNPHYIALIGQIIRKMVDERNLTVLMIEHNMHFVRNVADYCAFLSDGIIAKYGSTDDVLNDPNVRSSYLGL